MCTRCFEVAEQDEPDVESYMGATHTSYGDNGFVVNTSRVKSISAYGRSLKLFCKQPYNSRLIQQARDQLAEIAVREGFPADVVACAVNYFEAIFGIKQSKRYDTEQLLAACFYYACKAAGLIVGQVTYRTVAAMFGLNTRKLTRGLHIFCEYIDPPEEPTTDTADLIEEVFRDIATSDLRIRDRGGKKTTTTSKKTSAAAAKKEAAAALAFLEKRVKPLARRILDDVFAGNLLLKSPPHRTAWAVTVYAVQASGMPGGDRRIIPLSPYSRPIILNTIRQLLPYNEWLLRDPVPTDANGNDHVDDGDGDVRVDAVCLEKDTTAGDAADSPADRFFSNVDDGESFDIF